MAFKEPGKSPWEKNPQPNIEEFLNILQNKFKQKMNVSYAWLIPAALVLVWALTGIYFVEAGELGVVRRFGAMQPVLSQPGPHYRIPWPVDEVDVVKVEQIRSMELGFRTGQRGSSVGRIIPVESLMITGDENMVNIQVVVLYQISDLPAYLFKVWDPLGTPEGRTLRDAAETALRGVVGSMIIDEVLTVGRARVQAETKEHLQELMDRYETGLLITTVKLQAVDPPQEVDAAFKDVVSAKEDRERIINEAKSYQEDLIPKARGEAEQMLRAAEAYRETRIREAQGESARFLSMLKEYRQAKAVTRQRLYLETMQEVLSKVNKTVISSKVGQRALPLLPLSQAGGIIPRAAAGASTQGGQQ
ncbi:MAG: FtsH protease activity modulator HflK [SAR324 cluster bacterium]|nr:FtsH protease activity modulator HflK [SAR324 cluster bacterium]